MTTAVPKSDCETSKNCEGDEEKVLSPSEPGVVAHDPVHDPEKQTQGTAVGEDSSSADSSSQLLVTFDGPDDPVDPFNWPLPRKWGIALLSSFGGLVTLMSGTMMAPALPQIGSDLNIGDATTQMTLSIFVLSFAFGPMVLAPLAEIYGRRRVWLLSSIWYIIWNTVCGFARTNGLMIAGRFFAGLGASVEFAVARPILADCWRPSQRGQAFALMSFIPLLGSAIGPILGGIITEHVGWHWLFWAVSLFDLCVVLLGSVVLHESYRPIILARKAARLRARTSRPYYTDFANTAPGTKLYAALTRPVRLLWTQPALQLVSLFLALNFGILYITLSTFAALFTTQYDQSAATSGLHYIALVAGYTLAAQVGGRLTDQLWARLSRKAGGATAPEYRVPLMVPGAVLLPAGLLWYGWAGAARAPWIVTDLGAAIFGCGVILGTQAMQVYVLDAYADYTASASAASQLLRSIFGFAFPIFAPQMYGALGYGWGNSLLAFVFLAVGVPAPVVLWRYGARLRAMGKEQW
ncbi:hypothetical protein MMC34_001770 [Xylographa carneopallida]|nr:hypothetical protein [Xylographa carneopallida]